MKTRFLLPLLFCIAVCVCMSGAEIRLLAQETPVAVGSTQSVPQVQKKSASGQPQNAPVLVAGTQFMILDPVPVKPKEGGGKNRLPVSLVVLAWVLAMVLWQVYFNRKAQ